MIILIETGFTCYHTQLGSTVGSRSNPVPSQQESRSSSASDEAETVVDQFGWRKVNEDQDRSRSRSDPAFTAGKASGNIGNDCRQPIHFFLYFQHQLDDQ